MRPHVGQLVGVGLGFGAQQSETDMSGGYGLPLGGESSLRAHVQVNATYGIAGWIGMHFCPRHFGLQLLFEFMELSDLRPNGVEMLVEFSFDLSAGLLSILTHRENPANLI